MSGGAVTGRVASVAGDGYAWIERCDAIYQYDREYAYVQMRLLARELLVSARCPACGGPVYPAEHGVERLVR